MFKCHYKNSGSCTNSSLEGDTYPRYAIHTLYYAEPNRYYYETTFPRYCDFDFLLSISLLCTVIYLVNFIIMFDFLLFFHMLVHVFFLWNDPTHVVVPDTILTGKRQKSVVRRCRKAVSRDFAQTTGLDILDTKTAGTR